MRMANAKRFHDRCQREFEAFRKERLASGELECQKLINAAQAHLTQVCTLQARDNLLCLSFASALISSSFSDGTYLACFSHCEIHHGYGPATEHALASLRRCPMWQACQVMLGHANIRWPPIQTRRWRSCRRSCCAGKSSTRPAQQRQAPRSGACAARSCPAHMPRCCALCRNAASPRSVPAPPRSTDTTARWAFLSASS